LFAVKDPRSRDLQRPDPERSCQYKQSSTVIGSFTGGCRRRQRSFTASLHGKLFEDFAYFVDFPGTGLYVCHELDISIAGQLRIREQLRASIVVVE
jgi:hypothetical protein